MLAEKRRAKIWFGQNLSGKVRVIRQIEGVKKEPASRDARRAPKDDLKRHLDARMHPACLTFDPPVPICRLLKTNKRASWQNALHGVLRVSMSVTAQLTVEESTRIRSHVVLTYKHLRILDKNDTIRELCQSREKNPAHYWEKLFRSQPRRAAMLIVSRAAASASFPCSMSSAVVASQWRRLFKCLVWSPSRATSSRVLVKFGELLESALPTLAAMS